jgi:hypothetical protein
MRRLLLGFMVLAVSVFVQTASAAPADFASPLFGLARGHHPNVLLVADAGQGVVRVSGDEANLVVSLPGVTDVAVRGPHSLWALTSEVFGSSGSKLYIVRDGEAHALADLHAFEVQNNPHPAAIETDPFDVLNRGHGTAVVADAAGNDVIHVARDGTMKLMAVLPNQVVPTGNAKRLAGCPDPSDPNNQEICDLPAQIPAEPVATSVTQAPDGGLYVGELKGFPGPLHHSRVWHIDPGTRNAHCGTDPRCQIVFDDFTSIIDLRWFRGKLYVEQIDDQSFLAVELGQPTTGSVWACDVWSHECEKVAGGKPIMTAIAFRGNGSMWGTIKALIPGQADVIRLRPPQ